MKFLIVEDNPVTSELWEIHLSDYGSCTVVADGAVAVEAFQKSLHEGQPYGLICLDIMMPEMDGHETLREIRRIEKEQQINEPDRVKVIVMTALGNLKHIKRAFSAGCEAYLVKPVTKEELFKKMRKLGLIESEVTK